MAEYVVNGAGSVNVRPTPGTQNPPICGVASGQHVDVIGFVNSTDPSYPGKWAQVEVRAGGAPTLTQGFMYGPLLTAVSTTPPVVTPPPVQAKARIGFHVLSNGRAADAGYAAGARFFMVMDGKDICARLAAQGAQGMFRRYFQWPPSAEDMANDLAGLPDGWKGTSVNECEKQDGGTPAGILAKAAYEIDVATRLKKKNPNVVYAAGSFSMGTPDYTRPDICDAIRQGYAAAYNDGLIWWDHHLYSPNMTHIYGPPQTALSAVGMALVTGPVGRDQHIATWMEPTTQMDILAPASAFTDTPAWTDWFETRWRFNFTRCGFDPRIRHVVSGEGCSPDEGGSGGFVGHRASGSDVVRYEGRYISLQSEPITVNGGVYPSPFVAGAGFQLGDTSNAPGHWGSYAFDAFLADMAAGGVLA